MKKPHALAIARTPNIQIYEGLTELLGLVDHMGYKLQIICPMKIYEDEPLWKPESVNYSFIQVKNTKWGIPTTFKLFAHALVTSFKNQPYIVIGGDGIGNIVSAFIHRLLGIPFIYYGLELPHPRQPNMTWADKLEHWSIRSANMVVTMDNHHANFICAQTGISRNRCLVLPNAVSGPGNTLKSGILRKKYCLKDGEVLLLHAGGIGAAQQSIDLANAARKWRQDLHLVFHAHCRMDEETYFQQFANTLLQARNVHLNNEPVSPDQLDDLVRSADIGIAWYDHELLGYRAELLGLAAGKIGRYLKNGVPVIARNLPTIREYLDKYECGICVDRLEEIVPAVEKIENNYKHYSENAIRCYEELWQPAHYLPEIQRRIENLVR